MLTTRTIATLATMSVSSLSLADMIVYQNTGELGALVYYDPNFGNVIYGQSLDITLGTNQQPKAGDTPTGSIFFMHLIDLNGEFIWMGTGSVTNTAESTDFTLIPTPLGPEGVPYYGPQVFNTGDSIDESTNFVDGWRPIHGYNDLTGTPGIFTVDDTFTIAIEFEQNDGLHYGFAEFKRVFTVLDGVVDIDIIPQRWGYNDVAGEAAIVIPAPAGVLVVSALGAGIIRRRR